MSNPVIDALMIHVLAARRAPGSSPFEQAVYHHGDDFPAASLPASFPPGYGVPRECFANAGLAATDGLGTYCEGYAVFSDSPIAIHHAWLIDPAGRVIDPTWEQPELCHYRGFAIPTPRYLNATVECGFAGFFAPAGRLWPARLEEFAPGIIADELLKRFAS